MSLQTIITVFRVAATSTGFRAQNTIFGYNEDVNPSRQQPAYPAIQLIPPKIEIPVSGETYRITLNLFAFKKADLGQPDTGESVWPQLENLVKNWCQYVTEQKSLVRLLKVQCTPLVKGQSVEDAWAMRADVDIEVQCQINTI